MTRRPPRSNRPDNPVPCTQLVRPAADDDPRSQVRASPDCIVRFVDDDRRRGQVLYVEALGNESLNRRRVQTGHALVSLVERAGTERHGKVRKGQRIRRITPAIPVAGTSELVAPRLDARIPTPPAHPVAATTQPFQSL